MLRFCSFCSSALRGRRSLAEKGGRTVDRDWMEKTEALLSAPYWIVDILPYRVPKERAEPYARMESYFRKTQMAAIRQKFINLIMKLSAFQDIIMEGDVNPGPDRLEESMRTRDVYIIAGDAMFLSEPDDTYMTLFYPDGALLGLVRLLADSEGLFLWKGGDGEQKD